MTVPTDEDLVFMRNGDFCPDNRAGTLQVFLWQTKDGVAAQQKLSDFREYVMASETLVPPGDCIIFEFASEDKEKTDYLCEQYKVAELNGALRIERD